MDVFRYTTPKCLNDKKTVSEVDSFEHASFWKRYTIPPNVEKRKWKLLKMVLYPEALFSVASIGVSGKF